MKVSKFLNERHKDHLKVYNLSGNPYDLNYFNNNVKINLIGIRM